MINTLEMTLIDDVRMSHVLVGTLFSCRLGDVREVRVQAEPARGAERVFDSRPTPRPLCSIVVIASLITRLSREIESAGQLSYRLVLLVGPSRTGKTRALRELSNQRAWPLVNLNLALSERLLELKSRQRALRTPGLVDDIVREAGSSVVILDNLELLFHPDLQQDPLRLLQSISRNRTIVASWRGAATGSALTYASPDHPEFRRYENPQALIVGLGGDNERLEERADEELKP